MLIFQKIFLFWLNMNHKYALVVSTSNYSLRHLKKTNETAYLPSVSDNKKHDQQFVQLFIEKMHDEVTEIPHGSNIVVASDNCSFEHKSSANFHGMQKLSNQLHTNILRVYGIAELFAVTISKQSLFILCYQGNQRG